MVHKTARSVPVPLQVTPVCLRRHFQGGSTGTEKQREAEASPSFHQGCSGMLWAGLKVHRDKGRVRGLEGGQHCGGPQASSQQRDIPQKRPLELHREGEKKQERKREGESVAAQWKAQTDTEAGWRWLSCQRTGCRLWPGLCRSATASQGGALGLVPAGMGSGCPSYYSPTQAVPSSFGSKPRLQRLLLRQRYPP